MRALQRNKRSFWFALYEGEEKVRDEEGFLTGEIRIKFGKPQQGFANISSAQGYTETLSFGDNVSYDKIILFDHSDGILLRIDEHSVLWIDVIPQLAEDGSLLLDDNGEEVTPHDYVVRRVSQSINDTTVAISRVTVS